MANQKIKMTIQLRRDTAANWELYKNIVPAAGEPCFVTDKNILKIGDGVTPFEKLEPINGVKFELAADGKSIVLDNNVLKLMGFDSAEVGAQPRKNAEGFIEWVVPVADERMDGLLVEVSTLRTDVTGLQTDVADLKESVDSYSNNNTTLLSRLGSLENKVDGTGDGTVDAKIDAKINAWAEKVTDNGAIDTIQELFNYAATHGNEFKGVVNDIADLKNKTGDKPVSDQIDEAIKNSGHMSKTEAVDTLLSKIEAAATLQRVKYEISSKPEGTIVDYRDKEIRVMCPADTKWVKQNVGAGGNGNMYYMGFKAYAPEGAVSFKEGDRGVIEDEIFTFDDAFAGVDEFGRKYSICWLALASYDSDTDSWTYFGNNSSAKKYVGWTYCVEWYDANGIMIGSDSVRINLTNEACHNILEPYYITNMAMVKEVVVNGTLLDIIDGRVNITIPEPALSVKGSDEIAVAEDGTLSIKSISFSKIAQEEGEVIVMDGGSAV